jgi:hypothetical protein
VVGGESAAHDAYRVQEGEAVWILAPFEGGFVHQRADREVGQEQSVELLADEVRSLAAQHDAGATQVGLQLVERRLDLPALVVESGKLRGRGL